MNMGDWIAMPLQGSCYLFVIWMLLRTIRRLEDQVHLLNAIATSISTKANAGPAADGIHSEPRRFERELPRRVSSDGQIGRRQDPSPRAQWRSAQRP
jgi:hypothetical protein